MSPHDRLSIICGKELFKYATAGVLCCLLWGVLDTRFRIRVFDLIYGVASFHIGTSPTSRAKVINEELKHFANDLEDQLDLTEPLPGTLEEAFVFIEKSLDRGSQKHEEWMARYRHVSSGLDPWGAPLRYSMSSDGTFRIWSCGVNGIDEGGSGDDFVVERRRARDKPRRSR